MVPAQAIMEGLVELVKQGGPLALWGIGIWLIVGLIKIFVVCLFLALAIRLITNCIANCYKINKEVSAQRIQILSHQVSDKLTTSLDNFLKESLVVVNELKVQLKELKELLMKK